MTRLAALFLNRHTSASRTPETIFGATIGSGDYDKSAIAAVRSVSADIIHSGVLTNRAFRLPAVHNLEYGRLRYDHLPIVVSQKDNGLTFWFVFFEFGGEVEVGEYTDECKSEEQQKKKHIWPPFSEKACHVYLPFIPRHRPPGVTLLLAQRLLQYLLVLRFRPSVPLSFFA